MLDFKKLEIGHKAAYEILLQEGPERGCEYSFTNLYIWGRQRAAFADGFCFLFSQFSRRSVYPWPVGQGDIRQALDTIIQDASSRGIPCRITGLSQENIQTLQELYPDRFRFHNDRDGYDYVYAIDDLADLKGRKFQRKRNHFNRFCQGFPNHSVLPMTVDTLPLVRDFVEKWYERRLQEDPSADFHMERTAFKKALDRFDALGLEGLILMDGEDVLAVTIGSALSGNTFDIHFEKADTNAEGAYTAINCLFARHLRNRYPQLQFLNREDDMGIEGLRKAKLSYCPHHLVEKSWACLLEDGCEY